jgi:hypothetical protein
MISHQFTAASIAFVVVAAVMSLFSWVDGILHPPSDFFEVTVSVPDHAVGDDPKVVYERKVHRNMRGAWLVEIRGLHPATFQCSGDGVSLYQEGEADIDLSLSEFTGKDCELPAGQFFLTARWDMTDESNRNTTIIYTTEPFTVKEAKQ